MTNTRIDFKLNGRNLRTDLINITILLSFLTVCLIQTFQFSSILYFLIDVPILIMIALNLKKFTNVLLNRQVIVITVLLFLAFVFSLISCFINNVPFGNFIYGCYKYFRYFVFFYCVFAFTNERSEKQVYKIFVSIYWINLVLTLIEYFLLGIIQDLLGGVFGLERGVNQYTNLFFVIISVYCIEKIVHHDSNKKEYRIILIMIAGMLAVSALAELKYYFAEFLILFMIAYFCMPKKPKALIGILMAIVCIVVFYNILIRNFPEFKGLVSDLKNGGLYRLWDLQRHYSTDYDMGRGVIFSYSNKYLIPKKINQWIGLGIGSVSSSSMVDNQFWVQNQSTHYDQFYTSYLYIEQGIVGFIIYCLIFIYMLLIGIKAIMCTSTRKYGTMLIMSVVGFIMIFVYNMALYSQLAFIAFWMLAILIKKCGKSS